MSQNGAGRGLFIAQLAWGLLAILVLVTLVAAAGPRVTQLRGDPYRFGDAYDQLGISTAFFATYFTIVEGSFALIFSAVGGFIFWKASGDPVAILVSAAFIAMGSATPLPDALIESGPGWYWPVLLLRALGIGLVFFFLCLFPDGRFVPRSYRWLGLIAALYLASWFLFPALVPAAAILAEATNRSAVVPYGPVLLLTLLGIGGQIYRYRRVSTALQRQQTKWVVAGIVGFIFVEAISLILFALIPAARQPGTSRLLFVILFGPVLLAGAALIPLTTTLAILRYRLWDISIVVRRTLVYGSLSAVLTLAYFSSITLLQSIFSAASGQQSPLAIVISTLIIAALFTPLRGRVQGVIDRRFYRRKYDAERALATFAVAARDEVDLERLAAALLATVQDTMQPEQASLWLRPVSEERRSRS